MTIGYILLALGIIVFVVSFVIPVKTQDEKAAEFSEDMIRDMVGKEVESAKGQITDIVDETINYAMEKTERSMDRITNEKMLAVNEYSDTVLQEINKNHQEVVFLYDMLNDKHENLKNTVSEVEKTASEVKQAVKDAELTAMETSRHAMEAKEAAMEASAKAIKAADVSNSYVPDSESNDFVPGLAGIVSNGSGYTQEEKTAALTPAPGGRMSAIERLKMVSSESEESDVSDDGAAQEETKPQRKKRTQSQRYVKKP